MVDVLEIRVANGVLPGTPKNLITCDNDGDGFEIFDLTSNTTVTFHPSETDAIAGTNAVSFTYTNQLAFTQEVLWVRLEELNDNCFAVVSFTLDVFEDAVATQPSNILVCDDNGDGFFTFDFNLLQDSEVLNGLDPARFEVFYYTSEINAMNNLNPLAFPYTNLSSFGTEVIYLRVHNIIAPNICFDTSSSQLTVGNQPLPTQPTDYELCNNDNDGNDTDGIVQH